MPPRSKKRSTWKIGGTTYEIRDDTIHVWVRPTRAALVLECRNPVGGVATTVEIPLHPPHISLPNDEGEAASVSKEEFLRMSGALYVENPGKSPKWIQENRKKVLEMCTAGIGIEDKVFQDAKKDFVLIAAKAYASTPQDDANNTTGSDEDNEVPSVECTICLKAMTIPSVTTGSCGHLHCRDCMGELWKRGQKRCPYCRVEFGDQWQVFHPTWLWPGPKELAYQRRASAWSRKRKSKIAAIDTQQEKIARARGDIENLRSGRTAHKNANTVLAEWNRAVENARRTISELEKLIGDGDAEVEAKGSSP